MDKEQLPEVIRLDNLGSEPGITVEIRFANKQAADFIRYPDVETEGIHEISGSRIWIKRTLCMKDIRRTLIHEILHSALTAEEILGETELPPDKEETLCNRLEGFLDDFFSRPEIQALWIANEVK